MGFILFQGNGSPASPLKNKVPKPGPEIGVRELGEVTGAPVKAPNDIGGINNDSKMGSCVLLLVLTGPPMEETIPPVTRGISPMEDGI